MPTDDGTNLIKNVAMVENMLFLKEKDKYVLSKHNFILTN